MELYLRLNGYFSIRNYLQHRVAAWGLDTESDLLAIRMPYQAEVLEDGCEQHNDPILVLSGDQATMDFVIAEVKEPSVEFNKPIRGPQGQRLISAVIKMFGIFPRDAFEIGGAAHEMANDLHKQINSNCWIEVPESHNATYRMSLRMAVFAPKTAKHANERKHFDLQHVLDFTKDRMLPGKTSAPYRCLSRPSASPWRGSTRLIVETLDESHSSIDASLELEDFIRGVVSRWVR